MLGGTCPRCAPSVRGCSLTIDRTSLSVLRDGSRRRSVVSRRSKTVGFWPVLVDFCEGESADVPARPAVRPHRGAKTFIFGSATHRRSAATRKSGERGTG